MPTGFHSVDIPRKGGQALRADPADRPADRRRATTPPARRSGSTASAGRLQPAARPPGLFGKKVTFTGAKRVESGLPLAEKPKPFTVRFTKTGTYTYYCDVHAGMKGTVKVVAKKRQGPEREGTTRRR